MSRRLQESRGISSMGDRVDEELTHIVQEGGLI